MTDAVDDYAEALILARAMLHQFEESATKGDWQWANFYARQADKEMARLVAFVDRKCPTL